MPVYDALAQLSPELVCLKEGVTSNRDRWRQIMQGETYAAMENELGDETEDDRESSSSEGEEISGVKVGGSENTKITRNL